MTVSATKQKAIDYARNYPLVLSDSNLMGPVTVANVGEHNDRAIINFCLRTAKSNPFNATISFPKDWKKATQFKRGDQVNIQIIEGYVKNVWPAKPEALKAVKSNPDTDEVMVEPNWETRSRPVDSQDVTNGASPF